MHILIDARMYSSQFTGIGRYVYEITQQLFLQNPHWHFTLFLSEEEYEKFIPPSPLVKKVLAPEKIYSLKEQTSFVQKLLQEKGDITWFPHFNVPLLYPRPFVVTVHDLTLSKFPGKKHSFFKNILYRAIIKNALLRSKKILTVSQNTKKDLMEDESVSEEKITIAGNGVGKEFLEFSPLQSYDVKKLGIQKPFFLYTGQWRSHKNILGMSKAFDMFLQKNGNIAQLVITGKENPLYPELIEYRKKNNLELDIITPGLVDEEDLLHLYSKATAYVFPSFYEGFGIPPLEAMALGTPVIASNASSIPEVCGNAALYFNPSNIEDMMNKMEQIFFNNSLRNELIEKGKLQLKNFSWEKSAKIIRKEIENLLP